MSAGVGEPGRAILPPGIHLTPTLYPQWLSSTNARRTCNFNSDRCCQIALKRLRHCILLPAMHENEQLSPYCSVIITSISREALNHPSTCLTDNSRAASCTKAFLKPSHFLTLSNISDAKIVRSQKHVTTHLFTQPSPLSPSNEAQSSSREEISSFMFPVSI